MSNPWVESFEELRRPFLFEGEEKLKQRNKNEMLRKAGNLAREVVSTPNTEKNAVKRGAAMDRMSKLVRAIAGDDERKRFERTGQSPAHNPGYRGEEVEMKGEDPCWKGYQMVGTKKKGNREVPNCVPKKTNEEVKMKGEDPCWKGYQMVGTKKKGNREVPNCVPKKTNEAVDQDNDGDNDFADIMIRRMVSSGKMSKAQAIEKTKNKSYNKKSGIKKEQYSNWRNELEEFENIIEALVSSGEQTEKIEDRRKSGNKNKVDINPTLKLEEDQYEDNELNEKTLTAAETKKKEHIVMSMKSKLKDFEQRYPGRGKEVMYATATKMAKENSLDYWLDEARNETSAERYARLRASEMSSVDKNRQKKQRERQTKLESEADKILAGFSKKGTGISKTKSPEKPETPEANRRLKPGEKKDTLATRASQAMKEEEEKNNKKPKYMYSKNPKYARPQKDDPYGRGGGSKVRTHDKGWDE
jgi:ribosomal protein L39E